MQYSVVHRYAIDHVTHLMTNQQLDMWYLHMITCQKFTPPNMLEIMLAYCVYVIDHK